MIKHDETAVVKDLDPAEAAHLIDQLERGYQAAYAAAREAHGTPGHQARADLAADLDQLALDEHHATYALGMRQPGETIPRFLHRAQAEADAQADRRSMICPECDQNASRQPPADLVNWRAHGIDRPGWSHRDGTALCPVIGPSGGYQPARPAPEPGTGSARYDPPVRQQDHRDAERAQPGGSLDRDAQAGQRGAIPRQYMTGTIRRLDVTGPGPVLSGPAARPGRQAEREAGE